MMQKNSQLLSESRKKKLKLKANIEAAKCAKIKTDVLAKKESTEADLLAGIPLIEEAKKSL
jgi:hypothetical protein